MCPPFKYRYCLNRRLSLYLSQSLDLRTYKYQPSLLHLRIQTSFFHSPFPFLLFNIPPHTHPYHFRLVSFFLCPVFFSSISSPVLSTQSLSFPVAPEEYSNTNQKLPSCHIFIHVLIVFHRSYSYNVTSSILRIADHYEKQAFRPAISTPARSASAKPSTSGSPFTTVKPTVTPTTVHKSTTAATNLSAFHDRPTVSHSSCNLCRNGTPIHKLISSP